MFECRCGSLDCGREADGRPDHRRGDGSVRPDRLPRLLRASGRGPARRARRQPLLPRAQQGRAAPADGRPSGPAGVRGRHRRPGRTARAGRLAGAGHGAGRRPAAEHPAAPRRGDHARRQPEDPQPRRALADGTPARHPCRGRCAPGGLRHRRRHRAQPRHRLRAPGAERSTRDAGHRRGRRRPPPELPADGERLGRTRAGREVHPQPGPALRRHRDADPAAVRKGAVRRTGRGC